MTTALPFQPHLEEIEENYLAPSQILTPQVHMSQLPGDKDSTSKAPVSEDPDLSTDETAPELPQEDYLQTSKPAPNIQDKTGKGLSSPDLPADIYLDLAGAKTGAHDGNGVGNEAGNEAGMNSNKPPHHTDGYLALSDVNNSAIGSMAVEDLPTNTAGEFVENFQTD